MARIRIFIVLALALTAGGALAFATYNYVQNQAPRTISTSMPTRSVIVAATDMEVGAELTADQIKTIDWPANAVPRGAISDPKEVVGRGLIMPVIQNEPILPMKLASKEAGSGLPPAIPPGLRAVSVRVNEVIGVAGYVLPGTRVDVVATVNPSSQPADITSKVILTDVLVLAAGTKLEQPADREKPVPVNVIGAPAIPKHKATGRSNPSMPREYNYSWPEFAPICSSHRRLSPVCQSNVFCDGLPFQGSGPSELRLGKSFPNGGLLFTVCRKVAILLL